MRGFTIFWEAGWDFSKLNDEKLAEALQDCREVLSEMRLEKPQNLADISEQGDLLYMLEKEDRQRKEGRGGEEN